MEIVLKRPMVDVFICIIWSLILLPIALTNIEGNIRIILGLPILFFTPGYMLSFILFPLRKTKIFIDTIERLALSLALSMAIIPLIGIVLNYSPFGLTLEPILITLTVYIIGAGLIALYRWYNTPSKEKVITKLDISPPNLGKNLDTVITIILIASIITAPFSLAFVILSPRMDETYTEFYLLSSDETAEDYRRKLAIEEDNSVIIGIANHEHKKINYTIEIWLLNLSIIYNLTTFDYETEYDHMWYLDKMNVLLDHTQPNVEERWKPQWEYNYTFNITRKGTFKLLFLLFTDSTGDYSFEKDYKNIVNQKMNNSYRATNIWLEVSNKPKIYDITTNPTLALQDSYVNISFKVFDADGIDRINLRVNDPYNNRNVITFTNNRTVTLYYINKTYYDPGEYIYTIWANDTTNNFSISPGYKFYIMDTPTFENVSVSPTFAYKGDLVNISSMISDADKLEEVFLNITYPNGNVKNFSIIENKTGLIYYSNNRYINDGIYSFFIWAKDRRDNTNFSSVAYFTII